MLNSEDVMAKLNFVLLLKIHTFTIQNEHSFSNL